MKTSKFAILGISAFISLSVLGCGGGNKSAKEASINPVSEITFDGAKITESVASEIEERDRIKDIDISVNEDKREIDVVLLIESSADEDYIRDCCDDIIRRMSSMASISDSTYSGPSKDDYGTIIDNYSFVFYYDDGLKNFNEYGAAARRSNHITW